MAKGKDTQRTRNWTFILYPESANEDWRETIGELGIQAVVSPLHNRDTYEKDAKDGSYKKGDTKKEHYHIVFCFDSVKTRTQVVEVLAKLGKIPSPERVLSTRGAIRYLVHRDNPEKAQYSPDDIQVFGGVDLRKLINSSDDEEAENTSRMAQILSIIQEHQLCTFAQLADFLMRDATDLFDLFRKNSYFFGQYIKSKKNMNLPLDSEDSI